ncbi:TetR family transcriptional regulator [Pseudoflavonifractor sp. 524-17]|uniref:TetR family transcriptional regulator n=1 Tax=Pseudoflavonifractor sp. 524-17 TaxID=2304577 RepID=UPI00137AE93D|nr:TetR family transcriptional regulator [Pseudoflavonifractor sp. 524-17]NCE64408.1 TetR family transcriptional regulator [Pseudoflavonifractor sp. 524-17]
MCCKTKMKIAQALRQLMEQRPLSKITVQDLMESAQMKRQSFYYHFQDIYDVLLWIFEQQIGQPLREHPDAGLEEWCIQVLTLLEKDWDFYRRAFSAPEQVLLRNFCEELVRPKISLHLFQDKDARMLPRPQAFVVEFYTKSAVSYFAERITDRNAVNLEDARQCLHSMLSALHPVRFTQFRAQAG